MNSWLQIYAPLAIALSLMLIFFVTNNLTARTKVARAQTKLLAEIAKAQGVNTDTIEAILKEMN